jgi:hypothetical protein
MPLDTKKVGGQQSLTTDPVRATPANVAGGDPEFLDAVGVGARFSIKRSLLYELDNDGLVESVSLRRRGRTRGKRLFSVASIRTFLREQKKEKTAAQENGGGA